MNEKLHEEFINKHHTILKEAIKGICYEDILDRYNELEDVDDAIAMIMVVSVVTCAHDIMAHDAFNVLVHDIRRKITDSQVHSND